MTTPLTIHVDQRDGHELVLVATGEIDLSNVHTFARALDDAIGRSDGKPVTVDLSAVDYVDSGGINALFAAADHIHLIVKPLLMPVLTVSGLTELATVEPAQPSPNEH
jgi:anti-anti-sigma factor